MQKSEKKRRGVEQFSLVCFPLSESPLRPWGLRGREREVGSGGRAVGVVGDDAEEGPHLLHLQLHDAAPSSSIRCHRWRRVQMGEDAIFNGTQLKDRGVRAATDGWSAHCKQSLSRSRRFKGVRQGGQEVDQRNYLKKEKKKSQKT